MIAVSTGLTSCGNDDEPTSAIDYYLKVEEVFRVDGSTDHADRYYNPITLMKEAIRNAYPTPIAEGNDDAVINACDEVYSRFYSMYANKGEHLTCLVHLIKAHMSGDIVKDNELIKTYTIDVNPPEENADE